MINITTIKFTLWSFGGKHPMSDIGSRIKEIRKDHALTQEKFGQIIGLKDSAVSMLEKNDRRLTESVIKNIISQFCVNEIWLKDGFGEKYNEALLKKKTILGEPLGSQQIRILEKIQTLSPAQQEEFLNNLDRMNISGDTFSNSLAELSQDEDELLTCYRKLNTKDKDEILSFINFKIFNSESIKKKEKSLNCSHNKDTADIHSKIV